MNNYQEAAKLMNTNLKMIRGEVNSRAFDRNKVAEIEINEFFYKGEAVPRIMVVLRATGCAYYESGYGCSMCAHFDGTTDQPVTKEEYQTQWESVISGEAVDEKHRADFNINNFPILCLYNLGSLLYEKEVPQSAVREIFKSIEQNKGIQKVIIESRAEYVTEKSLQNIRDVYNREVEVGVGLESSNDMVRELCHHKNMPHLSTFERSIELLHKHGFKALAYVNQKPVFLTERESIDDAIATSIYAYQVGCDSVSIEPTSLQNHSLTDMLNKKGMYRVPWLWSIREVAKGIVGSINSDSSNIDLRIGGYFEEEVLSGSQGRAPGAERNELFPHETSGNCALCTPGFIKAIKSFNKSLDIDVLNQVPECPHCYSMWEADMKIQDNRTIPERIIATLGCLSI